MTDAYLVYEEILSPFAPRILRHRSVRPISQCRWSQRGSGRNADAHRSIFAGHRRRARRAFMDLVSLHGEGAVGQDHPQAGQPRATAGQTLCRSAEFQVNSLARCTLRRIAGASGWVRPPGVNCPDSGRHGLKMPVSWREGIGFVTKYSHLRTGLNPAVAKHNAIMAL